jgi:predicted DNA-binding transcriptional regulator YafY
MRNQEVVRQWKLLRTLDAHRHGATVDDLAKELNVTKRTIWRDMAALQEVGFPLTSDKDGKRTRWTLMNAPFKGLADLGVSMVELSSLYMGRAMVDAMAGAPFAAALATMTKKIEKALPPKMRDFLDRLPSLVEAKPGAVKKSGSKAHEAHLGKLIEASAERRVCGMKYFSASRGATKDYIVHPYRLVHANGGMYVLAWVPEYKEIRTFAVERIQKLSLQDTRFEIEAELSADAFGHSLGVNRGSPEKIVISFAPRIAAYVRERTWHKSQKTQDTSDGGVRMTLNVCADAPLRTWILGFGAFARVESPSWLAQEILEQLDEARDAYVPRLDFALPHRIFTSSHPRLPGIGTSRPS